MRSKLAARNSIYNILYLGVTAIISFCIRRYLVYYLGVEVLGVNAVIVETLNTLSLAELGIQTAISYRLYKPVAAKDEKREGEIFVLFRNIYRIIGMFIFLMGIIILPFIKYVIHSSIGIREIYLIYIVQLVAVVMPYFFSYYRILFLVHQKQYFCLQVDIITYIIFSFIQLLVVVIFKNYICYLLVAYLKFFISNAIIIHTCKREFPIISKGFCPTGQDKKTLFDDVKQIVCGNFAGYVYSSTDSLIISAFCGTLIVGYISNYKAITSMIRSCISAVNNSLVPTWGNYMQEYKDVKRLRELYYMLIFLEFVICSVTLIPVLCLADEFIALWIGSQYLIRKMILILIIMDIYINSVHEPNAILMRSLGMFKEDKWYSIFATIVNIVFSLCLVNLWNVEGVLIGTILALFVFWITRSKCVNGKCFAGGKKEYIYYIYKNIVYIFCFVLVYIVNNAVLVSISIENTWLGFVLKGVISESIIVALLIVLFYKSKEMSMVINVVVKPVLKNI